MKRHELRKIGSSYYSPVAPPNENSGSEEETAASSESSEARLSSPELNPDAPAEAAPNTQTPSIFARDPTEAAPNTQTPALISQAQTQPQPHRKFKSSRWISPRRLSTEEPSTCWEWLTSLMVIDPESSPGIAFGHCLADLYSSSNCECRERSLASESPSE